MDGSDATTVAPVWPVGVDRAIELAVTASRALLALGIPRCGACEMLPHSLGEIAAARPDLLVTMGEFTGPDDWRARERLLWPRGIHASRSCMPAMALLLDGRAVASRQAGGPARAIDRWLAEHLGPAERPVTSEPTPAEAAALERTSVRRARQTYIKRARLPT